MSKSAPLCPHCNLRPPVLKRPKTGAKICSQCFTEEFEEEIHQTIVNYHLFSSKDKLAIGASGGKDSTVLAHVLVKLNNKYHYGCELVLISVDEGIKGYRDDSLEAVKRNQKEFQIPLKIVSYKGLYGWTMDEIVKQIGTKNNCTVCGVFRRQSLDRGALLMGCTMVVTGHNADDMAETVLMNVLRGDIGRLDRCVDIITGEEGEEGDAEALPRCKPFKYAYEKEIVMYAYYNHLDYFSTECTYSPFAYRGFARGFLKDLERSDPKTIEWIVQSGESMKMEQLKREKRKTVGKCKICGFIASNDICKACVLLKGLNEGKIKSMMGNTSKMTQLEFERGDSKENHNDEKNGNNNNSKQKTANTTEIPPSTTENTPSTVAVKSSVLLQQKNNLHDW